MNYYNTPIGLAHLLPTFLPYLSLSSTDLPIFLVKIIEQITWPHVIGVLTFPVCAAKQGINCVQFWKASKLLTESDQEERFILQQGKRK